MLLNFTKKHVLFSETAHLKDLIVLASDYEIGTGQGGIAVKEVISLCHGIQI